MLREFVGTAGPLPLGRFAIVVARYNESITENLLRGAISTLTTAGIGESEIDVVRVPGAWEVPLAAEWFARKTETLAVIALAAVIRGETYHDQHLNRAVSTTLMQLGINHDRPILFGVLTCNTVEQAIHRSGGNFGNKGNECAAAALEMVRLKQATMH